MKLTKKALAVLLSVIMLISAFPFISFAEADKVITAADIEFRADIAGLGCFDCKDFVKINSKELDYADDYYCSVLANEVVDGDTDGAEYSSKFFSGTTYWFRIYLVAAEGYVLPESADDISLSFTDGIATETEIGYDDTYDYTYYLISFYATVSGTNAEKITSADISVRSDIAGCTYEYYKEIIKINSAALGYDDAYYPVISAYEVNDDGSLAIHKYKGEFVEGKTYCFGICFAAKDGYYLPSSEGDIDLTFTCDGEEIPHSVSVNNDGGYCYDYLEIEYTVTVQKANFFRQLIDFLQFFLSNLFENVMNALGLSK